MTEDDTPGGDVPPAGAPTNAPADAAPELVEGDAGATDVTAATTGATDATAATEARR